MAKNILWVNDIGDLEKLDGWLAIRPSFPRVVALEHNDTGAVSLCFFDGEYEAGIIRCASDDLADTVSLILESRDISVVTNAGGDQ